MIFSILIALIACSTPTPEGAGKGPPSALVEVGAVRIGALADTWTLTGEVTALGRAELAAGASGTVERVLVREGDSVTAGEVLLEVDAALARAQKGTADAAVLRAEAELDQLKRTLERVGRVTDGVLAADEIDQTRTRATVAEAELAGARAAARLASAQLGRHRVRAPFDGVVSRRRVDPGDWVDPGEPVLDVVQLDGVEVRVNAPLQVATQLRAGDTVTFGAGTGTVLGVVPALDPTSRTSLVRIQPNQPLDGHLPGSSIDVVLDLEMSGGVIVPRDALVTGPTETHVFKVVEGTARSILVTPLTRTADEVMVTADGLAAGDPVVIRGNERLRPDQAVRIR